MVRVDAQLAFEGAAVRAVLLEMRRYERTCSSASPTRQVTEYEGNGRSTTTKQLGTLEKLDKVASMRPDREMLGQHQEGPVAYAQRCTRSSPTSGPARSPRQRPPTWRSHPQGSIRDLR